jgi:hypothetical protein
MRTKWEKSRGPGMASGRKSGRGEGGGSGWSVMVRRRWSQVAVGQHVNRGD